MTPRQRQGRQRAPEQNHKFADVLKHECGPGSTTVHGGKVGQKVWGINCDGAICRVLAMKILEG
jgi:hypothetical protein